MGRREIEQAVGAMTDGLAPYMGRDWGVRAGSLEWSCWTTAAHVAHDLVAYAGQLAAGSQRGYLPFDLVVRPAAAPAELLEVVAACGGLLSAALAVADPEARAWHWGPTDPCGFAALGINEVLVHTVDITQGLGVDWIPPESLCSAVLGRLFPTAPPGDSVRTLLWATGRADLPDHPRVISWIPKPAIG